MRFYRILYFLVTTFLSVALFAQDYSCGTILQEGQEDFIKEHIAPFSSIYSRNNRSRNISQVNVPVQVYIIRRADGTGGLSISRISSLLTDVNNVYAPIGMTFVQVEDPIFIDNDDYFNLDSSQENELASGRDKNGVLNIYIPGGNLTSGGSSLCGYAYFPPSQDRIFVASGCADNEFGTTAHELGHYFSLFHTHGKTNTGTTDELVDGSNCTTAGDDICDTPADPNLSGKVSGCSYNANLTDQNGQLYEPNPKNIMSYAPNNCRDFFSQGQFDRIRSGLENGRSNLNLVYTNFTARFDVDARSGCAPAIFRFEDITNNVSSRKWSFPGAVVEESSLRVVNVSYENPGKYDVSLEVTNSSGETSTIVREGIIIVRDAFEQVIQDASFNDFGQSELPAKWAVDNEDRLQTFQFSDVSENGSGFSLLMNNYDYNAQVVPERDNLLLSSLEVGDLREFDINFRYAYTFRKAEEGSLDEDIQDALSIGYVEDCSDEVKELFRFEGDNLRTADPTSQTFVPSENDWKNFSLTIDVNDIRKFETLRTVRPVITNICYNGNNLYIDNISIEPDFSIDSIEFFRGRLENELVVLKWSNPAVNSRSVIIEKSENLSDFVEIATINPVLTEYIDTLTQTSNSKTLSYRIKNVNNIEESSYSTVVTVESTVTSVTNNNKVLIYPNPTTDHLFLKSDKDVQIEKVEVLSLSGKVLLEFTQPKSFNKIDISKLDSGIILVRMAVGNEFILKKVLKN